MICRLLLFAKSRELDPKNLPQGLQVRRPHQRVTSLYFPTTYEYRERDVRKLRPGHCGDSFFRFLQNLVFVIPYMDFVVFQGSLELRKRPKIKKTTRLEKLCQKYNLELRKLRKSQIFEYPRGFRFRLFETNQGCKTLPCAASCPGAPPGIQHDSQKSGSGSYFRYFFRAGGSKVTFWELLFVPFQGQMYVFFVFPVLPLVVARVEFSLKCFGCCFAVFEFKIILRYFGL